ncbi:11550_t:CDS:2, partial [Funneliformis geosporum]
ARAILIQPDLVNLWKEIGYLEICTDVNELVMQGALLIFFPPTPPNNWVCPDVRTIVGRLKHLIDLGFQLTDSVIEEALHLPEIKSNKANKRKSNEVNLEQNHNERKNWFKLLEEIYYHKLHTNNSNITENFKESFENFWDMITLEKIPELKYLSDNLNRNNENLSQQVFEGFSKKQKQ